MLLLQTVLCMYVLFTTVVVISSSADLVAKLGVIISWAGTGTTQS